MRIIIAPVGVPVFQEQVAVLIKIIIAKPSSRSYIQVKGAFPVGARHYGIQHFTEIDLRFFIGYLHAVDLPGVDAVFFVLVCQHVGIVLPVFEAAVYRWVEPGGKDDMLCPGGIHYFLEAIGELGGIRQPVPGFVPDIFKAAAFVGGVGTLPALPAIVQLEVRDAQPRAQLQFMQDKLFVDILVLPAVAPGILHDHIFCDAACRSDGFLVTSQRQRCAFSAIAENAGYNAVAAGPFRCINIFRRYAQPGYFKVAVFHGKIKSRVIQLNAGYRRFLEPEQAPAGAGFFHEKKVAS